MNTRSIISCTVMLLAFGTASGEAPKVGQQPESTARPPPAGTTRPATSRPSPGATPESVHGSLLEYQKQVNKEVREDRKSRARQSEHALGAKASSLKEANQQVGAGKDEAKQKSENARSAAGTRSGTRDASATAAATAASPKPASAVRKPCTQRDPC